MIFTQLEFLFFFLIVALFSFLISNNKNQKLLLLLSSYYFYAYWDWRFVGLILVSTVIDYTIGGLIEKNNSLAHRKSLVSASIILNLSLLGFFKYFNFFIDSLSLVIGSSASIYLIKNLILPVGISFYTFQSLSYTIDIYRNKLKPANTFLDFALYVSFFPQLVAGPIVRAIDFIPQLGYVKKISIKRIKIGFNQFVYGLFKKIFIADNLAEYIDFGFNNYEILSGLTLLIVALTYSIQIYCDFSGYSDMAIGAAKILGFKFNLNFDRPYISQSITEFWRRWHISLSSWLKDYLYISLGGNRRGKLKTKFNLFITMLLGGLWHGAAWNFIFWGIWHGFGLIIHKQIRSNKNLHLRFLDFFQIGTFNIINWALTMVFVCIGWIFFRSPDFKTGSFIIKKIFFFESGVSYLYPFAIIILIGFFVYYLISNFSIIKDSVNFQSSSILSNIIIFSMLWFIMIYKPGLYNPFIYFQF